MRAGTKIGNRIIVYANPAHSDEALIASDKSSLELSTSSQTETEPHAASSSSSDDGLSPAHLGVHDFRNDFGFSPFARPSTSPIPVLTQEEKKTNAIKNWLAEVEQGGRE